MNETLQTIHRTWVQLLIETNQREVAAIAIDTDLEIILGHVVLDSGFDTEEAVGIAFAVPSSAYVVLNQDDSLQELMESSITVALKGRIEFFEPYDSNPDTYKGTIYEYRLKSVILEEGWEDVIRDQIANMSTPNQGTVTEKLFARNNREIILYNEMKFASRSEVRIAQELERRKVLFFPLALGVRAETGQQWRDHREADFLVCNDGTWGILEVSYHPNRFEKDAEKDAWFKKSGILCVQHYTAERCFNSPAAVVNEFLGILAKHKR